MQRGEKFPIKLLIGLLLVSGIIFGLNKIGWLSPAKKILEIPVAPVRRLLADVLTVKVQRKIADLERQVAELTVDAAKVKMLTDENESLRKLLGSNPKENLKFTPVRIVGRGDEWLIAGEGIEVNDVVVSEEQVYMGTVTQVDEFVARVSEVEIEAETLKGAVGVVKDGELTQVVQKDPLEVGDIVVTRTHGLVIGKVKEVRQIASEVYKSAPLELLYSKTGKYAFIVGF